MNTCPLCSSILRSAVCPNCGFDSSCDFAKYPTLMPLPLCPAAEKGAVRQQEIPPQQGTCHEEKRTAPPTPAQPEKPSKATKLRAFARLPENKKTLGMVRAAAFFCYGMGAFSTVLFITVSNGNIVSLCAVVGLFLCLGLGIHIAKSRVCAILLLILAGCSVQVMIRGGYSALEIRLLCVCCGLLIASGVLGVIGTFRLRRNWAAYNRK